MNKLMKEGGCGTCKLMQIIGFQLRSVRKEKELTQEDLAVMLEVNREYLSRIENGKFNIRVSTLEKIARVLDVDIGTLIIPPPLGL